MLDIERLVCGNFREVLVNKVRLDARSDGIKHVALEYINHRTKFIYGGIAFDIAMGHRSNLLVNVRGDNMLRRQNVSRDPYF